MGPKQKGGGGGGGQGGAGKQKGNAAEEVEEPLQAVVCRVAYCFPALKLLAMELISIRHEGACGYL